ncbi:uncharacterized protein LOC103471913 [Poecilia reticulata]|uniref:uncharacterized protein LOC103471913 n=1 Tax=Poecilia reticulata TaxID=8081 RepID=UPI0007E94BD4|nr:PREDICTED: uncharacterized protein LOC103471913 [Poecilia reticulata]
MLPKNVVLRTVLQFRKKLGDHEMFLEATNCKLQLNQLYSLSVSPGGDSVQVQPTEAEPDEFYEYYFSSYQVSVNVSIGHVTLSLVEFSNSCCVWKRDVCLFPAKAKSFSSSKTLKKIGNAITDRKSGAEINPQGAECNFSAASSSDYLPDHHTKINQGQKWSSDSLGESSLISLFHRKQRKKERQTLTEAQGKTAKVRRTIFNIQPNSNRKIEERVEEHQNKLIDQRKKSFNINFPRPDLPPRLMPRYESETSPLHTNRAESICMIHSLGQNNELYSQSYPISSHFSFEPSNLYPKGIYIPLSRLKKDPDESKNDLEFTYPETLLLGAISAETINQRFFSLTEEHEADAEQIFRDESVSDLLDFSSPFNTRLSNVSLSTVSRPSTAGTSSPILDFSPSHQDELQSLYVGPSRTVRQISGVFNIPTLIPISQNVSAERPPELLDMQQPCLQDTAENYQDEIMEWVGHGHVIDSVPNRSTHIDIPHTSGSVLRRSRSNSSPLSCSLIRQDPPLDDSILPRAASLPNMKLQSSFEEITPGFCGDPDDETYWFQCSSPGLYQCRVSGFSAFGNVKDEDSPPDPVRALVLLFYKPPADPESEHEINVLMLPKNVVLNNVLRFRKKLDDNEIFLETPPNCKLQPNQLYSLSVSPRIDSVLVQPTEAEFDAESYENYVPTFQVVYEEMMKHIILSLRDSSSSIVWDRRARLSSARVRRSCGPTRQNLSPKEKLMEIRIDFIDGVSGPVLQSLMDNLLKEKVINDSEREAVEAERTRGDKARVLIDTVRRKGDDASSKMICFLCDLDRRFSESLGLM